jgi:hypothetical protein
VRGSFEPAFADIDFVEISAGIKDLYNKLPWRFAVSWLDFADREVGP